MAVVASVQNDPLLRGWTSTTDVKNDNKVGHWVPIKDITDPHVQDIGEFAVKEFDRETGIKLKFVRVLSGETQVVAGVNYRLVLEASLGGLIHKYEAIVWEKSWEHFMKLISFVPLPKN